MRMAWQDVSPFPTPRMDAEEEREMRLAAQARAGAEWALAALIARYQPPVLRYLTRLTGNAPQSHLMAERIFVRMERRLRGPHGAEHLRLWLLRAATESGLDLLRHPKQSHQQTRLNAPAGPRGLLMDGLPGGATDRLRAGLSKIAEITGSTRRQVRQLIWDTDEQAATTKAPDAAAAATGSATETPPAVDPTLDTMNPHEELRHRLIRAVLSELPYGDAQCLALHLVAGLNQTEVARALGIRPSAARHRIVQGLQMFAHRYDAAITSLGVPIEVAYAENAESLPAPAADAMDTLDVARARDEDYAAAASLPRMSSPAYADHDTPSDAMATAEPATYQPDYDEIFPEVYGGEYDLAEAVSASVVSTPVTAPPTNAPTPAPMIVDALPTMPATTPAGEYWLGQPTTVPVLSLGSPTVSPDGASDITPGESSESGANGTAVAAVEGVAEHAPLVPVLTPPNWP